MERKTPPVFYRREGFDSVFKRKRGEKAGCADFNPCGSGSHREAGVLIKNHRVKRLIVPVGFVKEPKDQNILNMAKENNIPVAEAKRGDTITAGDLQFQVLSPESSDGKSKNDSSLVLWTVLGGVSWLLTGDLESDGETEVLKTYPKLKADILKAGHHGSKSSTSEAF